MYRNITIKHVYVNYTESNAKHFIGEDTYYLLKASIHTLDVNFPKFTNDELKN